MKSRKMVEGKYIENEAERGRMTGKTNGKGKITSRRREEKKLRNNDR